MLEDLEQSITDDVEDVEFEGQEESEESIEPQQEQEFEPQQEPQQEAAQDEITALKNSAEFATLELAKVRMNEDLRAIQAIDKSVKSLSDLGSEYLNLIGAGVSAVTAFNAIKASQKQAPSMGDINVNSAEKSDFFSKDEVAKMSGSEIDKNYDKVMKSMKHWK